MEEITKLTDTLKQLAENFPIEWDRFTQDESNNFHCVYGWINRSDGQRDFILIEYWSDCPDNVWYCTSSAKYSAEISKLMYGETTNHNQCQKVENLPGFTPK